ncbi:MAG: AraC family transcriptional regulator [Actinobacteria bacterium]|nr:AraC family transcriptional regulator [Actinomycetota bacterium]
MVSHKHNRADDGLFPCQAELIGLFETLINVIFCAKDLDGRYVEVNSAFVRRTGSASKGSVIGSRAVDHFAPELAERYEHQDKEVVRSGQPLYDELELIRRPDGVLGWYLTTKLPVYGHADRDRPIGVVSVSRDLVAPSESDIGVHGLRSVVRHVQGHLEDRIRVADLATIAECSQTQLGRRMKRVFGVTTTQYILRVRVEAATRRLVETDDSIAVVAVRCGFYDQPDFTRRFARLTNSTPAQFRLAAQHQRDDGGSPAPS